MKKIVFVSHSLLGGGAEHVTVTIIRLLRKRSAGCEIHLVVIDRAKDLIRLVPPEVIVHELEIPKTCLALFRMVSALREIAPDCIFTSEHPLIPLLTVSAFFCRKKPELVFRYSTTPNGSKKTLRFRAMKYSLAHADALIAQTEEMKQALIDYYGLSRTKVTALFNPVDTDRLEECVKDASSPFDGSFYNLLCCGTLYQVKGQDIAIKALRSLLDRVPGMKVRLYLVGKNHWGYQEHLQELCNELGVKDNVIFVPYTDNPFAYIRFCDALVLASRREGLPNVLLEALYFRRKIVATDCVPVISQLVTKHDSGIVVPPEDPAAMSKALEHVLLHGDDFHAYGMLFEQYNREMTDFLLSHVAAD